MIFKVDKDKDIFKLNPELKTFDKMSKCSDRELRWIFFVYDYETPFRRIPMEIRKEKAADHVGFKRERGSGRLDKNARNTIGGKLDKVNSAIEEFLSLQYDQDRELVLAYDRQIQDAILMMQKPDKDEKEWSTLLKLNKELPGIRKNKKELEASIGMRTESDEKVNEDSPLSALDIFHEDED